MQMPPCSVFVLYASFVHELHRERYTVKNGVVHCTHHVTHYKQSTQSPKLHRDYPVDGLEVPMLNVD